jgi:hypothetical protein
VPKALVNTNEDSIPPIISLKNKNKNKISLSYLSQLTCMSIIAMANPFLVNLIMSGKKIV